MSLVTAARIASIRSKWGNASSERSVAGKICRAYRMTSSQKIYDLAQAIGVPSAAISKFEGGFKIEDKDHAAIVAHFDHLSTLADNRGLADCLRDSGQTWEGVEVKAE